jgi:hypothetical protein
MPFRSRAQWKWAFANKKDFADKWAHQTTGTTRRGTKRGKKAYAALPTKKRTTGRKSPKRVAAGRKAARTRKRRGR